MPYMASDGLVLKSLEFARTLDHIMDFTKMRALGSLFSLINQGNQFERYHVAKFGFK